jgi:hypothetical protein
VSEPEPELDPDVEVVPDLGSLSWEEAKAIYVEELGCGLGTILELWNVAHGRLKAHG